MNSSSTSSSTSSSVDLSTSVGGIHLETCLYNASGPRSGTASALQKIADGSCRAGAVLSKSATLQSQQGNPQPRTWHSKDGVASLNSEGLPNNGIDYYIAESTITEAMGGEAPSNDNNQKPYFVSLSGKTLNDNLEMFKRISESPVKHRIKSIELNLACPNVIGKPIIAYDFEQMNDILIQVGKIKDSVPPIGVKLPPYLDFQHFKLAADILNKHKATVKYVASINTIGNALAIDLHAEAPPISANSGFAGLSGPAVKYTALANVRKLRELLDPEIDIVGVGGICTGEDVFDMILAGATACQTATTHWKEGPACFQRILDELQSIMRSKGYTRIADFKGKLKDWSKDGAALSRSIAKESNELTTTTTSTAATTTTNTSKSLPSQDLQTYRILSAILILVIAMLLSDKYGVSFDSLMPSE